MNKGNALKIAGNGFVGGNSAEGVGVLGSAESGPHGGAGGAPARQDVARALALALEWVSGSAAVGCLGGAVTGLDIVAEVHKDIVVEEFGLGRHAKALTRKRA